LLFCGTISYPYIFNYGSSRENSTSSYDNSAFADPCAFFWTNLVNCQLLYSPFCRPVTEATKPPQQLTTPNSSGDVNVTSLIAKLLTGYDKRLRPRFGGKDNDLCLIFIESVCLAWSHRYITYILRDRSNNDYDWMRTVAHLKKLSLDFSNSSVVFNLC